jgi:drug/metabolite transporter superfamily protein YnfA
MRPTTPLAAFVLFAIVTVEFGGWSLLGFLTGQDSLTPFEEQFFRAGHAHAGVLLILALVYLMLMDRTRSSCY